MAWYDFFANFYDQSLEAQYREQRAAADQALRLAPGQVVLDVPCGTGQSFNGIVAGIGPTGKLLGVDLSAGMLRRAGTRIEKNDWENVHRLETSATTLSRTQVHDALGGEVAVDRLQIFLGITAFPAWQETFNNLWSLLAPGGRCVIADVHASKRTMQTWMVEKMAQADLNRVWWEPLEACSTEFERVALPTSYWLGGEMWLATGVKGDAAQGDAAQ